MKYLLTTVAALAFAGPGMAEELIKVRASGTVAETMDALEAAVTGAGAAIVARVDHAAAAGSVGMDLAPEQLLVFGNPKLGTPAMQDDPRAGLFLPLRVLVYEDSGGAVWLTYQDPGEMFDHLAIDEGAPYVATMRGALNKLTGAAAGG